MKFELLVAVRYLKAKRKQAVISLITIISIVGVAAGVAALIIALAITAGFREDLQNKLLGAQAHVSILSRGRSGISNYLDVSKQVEQVPGVVFAAPAIFQKALLSSETQSAGIFLKGIIPDMETRLSALSQNMVEGSLSGFQEDSIVIGKELAKTLGTFVGDRLSVTSFGVRSTPFGLAPISHFYHVTGIFESGLYDYDSGWAYVPLAAAQRLIRVGDVANVIEVKVDDIYQANEIGQKAIEMLGAEQFDFTEWRTMNATIFQALRLERVVTSITIGLIVLVAALNIVATLIMMVLEKTRDIAILLSMGATQDNIRRIFILQGVIIGVIGTVFGVVLGQVLCYFADKYHLIRLAPEVYTIAYVPFRASPLDSVIVAAAAILISFLATLYPSAAAAKLQPVEALRYE
jgi:lipoprotein-releasing system permease protein